MRKSKKVALEHGLHKQQHEPEKGMLTATSQQKDRSLDVWVFRRKRKKRAKSVFIRVKGNGIKVFNDPNREDAQVSFS